MVVYHAFPMVLRGGFIGVDIFFVISGYLISSIIFRGLQKGKFSFVEFYTRRIQRIFPALAAVLAATYVAGWFVLLPNEYEPLGKHMAASAAFVENFVLRREVSYFDIAAELKPLLHLWSLAIEEQFYLIFPVLMWGAWRLRLNLFIVAAVLALASFVANVKGIDKSVVKTFYMPKTRFWELLAGVCLAYPHVFRQSKFFSRLGRILPAAFRPSNWSDQRSGVLANILSVLGLITILAAVSIIRAEMRFPGWWAIAPVAGALLLIMAGPQAWVNRTLLANRGMIFIGLISYPLYLWHWPILSLARIVNGWAPPLEVRIGAVAASFLLAWATYRFVEKPVRFGPQSWIKPVALVASVSSLGLIGFATYKDNGFEFRLEKDALRVARAAGEWEYPGQMTSQETGAIKYYAQESGKEDTTLFIGDSNIEQYYPRIDELIKSAPANTNSAFFLTQGGCLPIPGVNYDRDHGYCATLMSDAAELIRTVPRIKTVVIGAQWNGRLAEGSNLAGETHYGTDSYKAALTNLSGFVRDLVAQNKDVYVVLNIPLGLPLHPRFIIKRDLTNFPYVFRIGKSGVDRTVFDGDFGLVQADLARVATAAGAMVIRPMDYLCRERCEALDKEGEPMYKDNSHLRPSFVRKQVSFLDVTVRK